MILWVLFKCQIIKIKAIPCAIIVAHATPETPHPKTITNFELEHPIIAFELKADLLHQ